MYFGLLVVGLCLLGYAYGNVMWAVILGKLKNIDIRAVGSKNPGATNLTRNTNKLMGITAAVLDITKSVLPMVLYMVFVNGFTKLQYERNTAVGSYRDFFILLPGIAAYLGHCFPLLYLINLIKKTPNPENYSGGKGVAVFGGIMIALSPYLALIGIATWIIVTYSSKYVSLASMVTPVVMTSLSFVNPLYVSQETNYLHQELSNSALVNVWIAVLLLFLTIMIIVRHHKNIYKLIHHTENKIGKKNKAK